MIDDKITTINNIDRLRDERDSIFRSLELSNNTSERRSLKWAWNIKQSQLARIEIDSNNEQLIPPINPISGKPYFETRDDAWSGELVAGEVQPIPSSEFGGDNE